MIAMEVKLEARTLFGYVLVIIGVMIILFTVLQAYVNIGRTMEFINELMPGPTITIWRQQFEATEMPGFIETLGLFLMLTIELLAGFFIASIGVKIAKK